MNQAPQGFQERSEPFRCGYVAAFCGYSMHAPSVYRKKTEVAEFEDGWMTGTRVKTSLLKGIPTVRVGQYSAHPVAILRPDGTEIVKWRFEVTGKDYATASEAEAALYAKIAQRAALGWLEPAPAGCPA